MRSILVFLFLLNAFMASAQLFDGVFHIGWNTTKPLSDKDFIEGTTSRGLRLGYTKYINNRFGVGLEGMYTTLDEYVPRQTYYYDGGAITTDIFNYLYYFTIGAQGQYYFLEAGKLQPYAAMGIGITFTEYKLFYNIYSDSDSRNSLYLRPELGVNYRFKEYGGWGLKSTIGYEYATNKSEYFDIRNFSAINFQFGVVFFTD
jgi:hypothetical protein